MSSAWGQAVLWTGLAGVSKMLALMGYERREGFSAIGLGLSGR